MTLRLYQAGLQVTLKHVTARQRLYQAGLQTVIRRKNPVYNLYQGGVQTVVRQLNMPQHAEYSIYDLPLELVYEPAPETIQFSHCLEPGYFFAVDHSAELHDGGTLTVRVYGGVPPYTWSLDVGTQLALSATETEVPYVTLSIVGVFAIGTEELTVEDACGSQATICIYLCNEYAVSSYACLSEYSCSEACRRTVTPIEPPVPPPPVPSEPPGPPEVPLAPHETVILTAAGTAEFESLDLLIVSFWNDPDNTEVRFLWDLNTMSPYEYLTKEDYDAKYAFFGPIRWVDDLLVEGASVALPTINEQNYDGILNLTVSDFGFPTSDQSWGCGNDFVQADFVPLWCEDTQSICLGGPCGGVNFSADFYDKCTVMPPWDSTEVTKNARGKTWNVCEDFQSHVWPNSGIDWNTTYDYGFSGVQSYDALLYFQINWNNCPPWSYAKLQDSDIDVWHTLSNISVKATDLALGANEDHGYVKSGSIYSDPGDWGSIELVAAEDPYFTPLASFVRTSQEYYGLYFHEDNGSGRWDGSDGCINYPEGEMGMPSLTTIHEELFYEYFTHFGRIGLFYPFLGLRRGETLGHRKFKVVAEENLQCQIFLFQRSETLTAISNDTTREGTFHAALEVGELSAETPKLLPQRRAFETALGQLFDFYYDENDYDSGGLMSSKIDPDLAIRVGRVSAASIAKFYELPVEVVYERS